MRQSIDETIWIVDIYHIVVAEMITIIIIFQIGMSFPHCPIITLGHLFQFGLEVLSNFLLCNSAKGCIFRQETDVGQVIEHREQGYLCKLGDTRNKDKLFILIIHLEHGKYRPIDGCTCFMLRSPPRMLQRRIVFVDKNANRHSCYPVSSLDDVI